MGVKFVHRGRIPVLGLDCIGLVLYAIREGGWVPSANSTLREDYARWPEGEELSRAIALEMYSISYEELQPGDVVTMAWEGMDDYPRHVAMITQTNPNYIIHTHWLTKRVAEHRIDQTWKSRIRGCWGLRD